MSLSAVKEQQREQQEQQVCFSRVARFRELNLVISIDQQTKPLFIERS